MPDFSNDQQILFYCLNSLSKSLPEEMTDFVTYIHSPSIDIAFLNPITCNICNEFFNLRIFQIQLWHSIIITKTFEVRSFSFFTLQRKSLDKIPVQISGFFFFFYDILKCKKISSCMVEYRIHHYFHSTLMRFLHQFLKILCCSKGRIDLIIISGIIFMAGIRFKNRC